MLTPQINLGFSFILYPYIIFIVFKKLKPLSSSAMPQTLLSPRTAKMLPWLVSMAFFMQMLDSTIVNTALPAIASSLNENPLNMQMVVTSYLLSVAILIPASGWLADRFGSRHIFMLAITLFTAGSLACAISDTLNQLVLSRILQGLGGALLVPVGRLILLRAYPREQLIRLLSLITIPALIGPLIGPTVGGFLVEYASWHWIFLINLPIGIAGFILSWLWMPEMREDTSRRFDWPGFFMFGGAMALLSFSLEELSERALPYTVIALMTAGGGVIFILYWLYAARIKHPLFSLSLFKTNNFTIGILGNLITRLGSGAMPLLLPLLLQVVHNFSPAETGMLMIAVSLAAILSKIVITPLVHLYGYRLFLTVNSIALGLTICSFALLGSKPSMTILIILLLIMGTINAMQFTAMNTLTLVDLPDHDAAGGNSLLSVVMQLAVSFGVSVAAVILQGYTTYLNLPPDKTIDAFNYTFLSIGLITLLGSIVFLWVHPSCGKSPT